MVARSLGLRLRYHGDFDWAGIDIAGRLIAAGARPWRLTSDDYAAAVTATRATMPLAGRPVDTRGIPRWRWRWTAPASRVHEEALASALLCNLR